MPDPFPMPNDGGPLYTVFAPDAPDGDEQTTTIKYADGGADYNFIGNPTGIRRWRITYDDLTPTDAAILDAHFAGALKHSGFILTTPNRTGEPSETLSNVHYVEYRRPAHNKYWLQRREIVLEKRPA